MNIMKTAVLVALLFTSYSAHGQDIIKADHLSPEDFGARKWILRGTASTNEVVIFRRTRTTTRGDAFFTVECTSCRSALIANFSGETEIPTNVKWTLAETETMEPKKSIQATPQ